MFELNDMKRRQLSFLLLILAVVSTAFAQKEQHADVREQNLRRHIEYLASDKLEGRRTGEQGATYAAGYVADAFAKFKLKPGFGLAKGKTSYLQPFPYVSGVTLGKDNFLRIVPGDSTRENKMETGVNWMPLGFSPNADIAPISIVFAGYGISASDLKYDDYAGLDVKEKIVLIFDSTPDAGNPHSEFGRYNVHLKASIAKDKGAKAIILIAEEGEFKNDRLSVLNYDRTLGETAVPVVGIMRSLGAELLGMENEKSLGGFETALFERANKATGPLDQPAALSNAVAQVKIVLTKKHADAYNVIGILEGTDPALKNEAIIIGAHYDHLGHGGQGSLSANSTEIHHGADDNASGTAAILELARQFAREKSNKRTMIFMAFAGEEEGLLGSKFYVENPVWPLEKTIAMINMDMVGRLNENKLTIGGIGTASEWKTLVAERNGFEVSNTVGEQNVATKNEIDKKLLDAKIPYVRVEVTDSTVRLGGVVDKKKLAQAMQIAVEGRRKVYNGIYVVDKETSGEEADANIPFLLQLNEDGYGPSDHSSFYGKKIPVLFLFTGTHLDYHKPSDTADKINYEGEAKIISYIAAIVRSIDQNPTRPTYTTVKVSSTTGGRMGFNISLGTIPSYADTTDGLVLDGVRDNSPASKAGLKAGDKITKLNGKEVRNAMDYTYVLGTMKAGEEYEVEITRGTEKLMLKIVPAPAARRP